jgi:hypothetical protein
LIIRELGDPMPAFAGDLAKGKTAFPSWQTPVEFPTNEDG